MILVLVKCSDPDRYQCIDHVIILQEEFNRKAIEELLDEYQPIPSPVIAGHCYVEDDNELLDELEGRMFME